MIGFACKEWIAFPTWFVEKLKRLANWTKPTRVLLKSFFLALLRNGSFAKPFVR